MSKGIDFPTIPTPNLPASPFSSMPVSSFFIVATVSSTVQKSIAVGLPMRRAPGTRSVSLWPSP